MQDARVGVVEQGSEQRRQGHRLADDGAPCPRARGRPRDRERAAGRAATSGEAVASRAEGRSALLMAQTLVALRGASLASPGRLTRFLKIQYVQLW